jgi:hypothetical protein
MTNGNDINILVVAVAVAACIVIVMVPILLMGRGDDGLTLALSLLCSHSLFVILFGQVHALQIGPTLKFAISLLLSVLNVIKETLQYDPPLDVVYRVGEYLHE